MTAKSDRDRRPTFKCPDCGQKCQANKHLSHYNDKDPKKRLYVYECNGLSTRSPHTPRIWRRRNLSIDEKGNAKVVDLDAIYIETAYDELADWRESIKGSRFKNLPKGQKITYDSGHLKIIEKE